MTKQRHMVTIETETTGRIVLTSGQFDLLLMCAEVGLDGYEGPDAADADILFDIVQRAAVAHSGAS